MLNAAGLLGEVTLLYRDLRFFHMAEVASSPRQRTAHATLITYASPLSTSTTAAFAPPQLFANLISSKNNQDEQSTVVQHLESLHGRPDTPREGSAVAA
jgi:hypothetical protein